MFPSVIVGGHAAAAPAAKSGDHNDIMIIMLMMPHCTAHSSPHCPTDQNYCLRPNIFEESHIYTDNLINPCNYLTKTSY